ncbi:hypothetical protein DPMN_179122 [Dreissena polymorpha]|uniref:Uncharacterized protein n=1 Tax=Dreissena polymorpha TaxID=45954 RepID=A0A9D4EEK3_DREPO|nr:hypothetical protein DPMN_179122 [Dreissena polymorpha]
MFNPIPMSVVNRQGNSDIIESKEGLRYSRNVAHVKKFNTSEKNQNKSVSENESVKSSMRKDQSENQDMFEKMLMSLKNVSQNGRSVINEQSAMSKASLSSENEKQVESNVEEKDRKAEQSMTEPRALPIKSPAQMNLRPARERKTPQRFSDCVMSKK